jgi:hypothetical protein
LKDVSRTYDALEFLGSVDERVHACSRREKYKYASKLGLRVLYFGLSSRPVSMLEVKEAAASRLTLYDYLTDDYENPATS